MTTNRFAQANSVYEVIARACGASAAVGIESSTSLDAMRIVNIADDAMERVLEIARAQEELEDAINAGMAELEAGLEREEEQQVVLGEDEGGDPSA